MQMIDKQNNPCYDVIHANSMMLVHVQSRRLMQ